MVAPFHIRGLETDADRRALRRLLVSGFDLRPGLGMAFAQLYDALIDGDAGIPAECSRLALVEGRIVGHALLAPRMLCVDGLRIPGGVLAMVVVAPEHRGRGMGSALVRDAEALALRRGACLLHLAGDLRFYCRFGYVEGYVRCRADATISPAERGASPPLRRATAADADQLARLSRLEVPCGAAEPTAGRWRWVLRTGHPFGLLEKNEILLGFCAEEDFCLLLEGGEDPRGFVRAAGGGGIFALYEAAAEDEGAAARLLGAAVAFAARSGYERLSFHLPPSNRLLRAAAAGGASVQAALAPDLLVKILNVPALMGRFSPLLSARFGASALSGWQGCVAFRVGETRFLLACREGKLEVRTGGGMGAAAADWGVTLPGIGLARALLGTDSLAERMVRQPGADAHLTGLLDALFPARHPTFWLADSL